MAGRWTFSLVVTLVLAGSVPALAQTRLPLAVSHAEPSIDEMTGMPVLMVYLSDEARADFAAFSQRNVGRRVDMLVDGEVVTSAIIQSVMNTGELMLTGNFTVAETGEMAEQLNASLSGVAVRLADKRKND